MTEYWWLIEVWDRRQYEAGIAVRDPWYDYQPRWAKANDTEALRQFDLIPMRPGRFKRITMNGNPALFTKVEHSDD